MLWPLVRALTRFTVSLSVWGLAAASQAADAQTGFHSAAITRVAVDPAARILATASEDKTVRLWALPSGQPLGIMRPPVGAGAHGKIYALAISPDGKAIAFGGFTGQKNGRTEDERLRFDYEVYVHDLGSGKRLRTLDVPALVDQLSYSRSGEYLIASASSMPASRFEELNYPLRALTIFRTRDYQRLVDVPPFYAAVADLDSQGRLVVIGRPGGHFVAELLDQNLRGLESRTFRGDPAAISLAPDGTTFAVSTLYAAVHVHSTRDLSLLYDADLRGAAGGGSVPDSPDSPQDSTVAWSTDGRFLYFASKATCQTKGCAIRKWSNGGRGPHVDLIVSPDRVTHLSPLPGGGIAFGTAGPAFGVVDVNDVRVLYRDRTGVSSLPVAAARQAPGSEKARAEDQSGTPGPQKSRLPDADADRLAELHGIVAASLQSRRPGDALPVAHEALKLAESRLLRDDAALIQPLLDLGRAYYQAGRYRAIVGSPGKHVEEYREARTRLERALALLERQNGRHHPDVADLLEELADLREAMKNFDEALDLKQRVLAIRKGGDPSIAKLENDLELLRVRKLLGQSSPELSKALPLALAQLRAAEFLGPDHPNVARGRSNLAAIYQVSRVGLRAPALHLREAAQATYSRVHGPDHWETVGEVAAIARLYGDAGEWMKAERLYESTEAMTSTALGPSHEAVMEFLSERARVLRRQGQYDEAAARLERALAFWDDRLARRLGDHPILDVRRSLESLADTYALMRAPAKAESLYRRLLTLKDHGTVMRPFMVARVLGKLGEQARVRGDLGSARSSVEQALKLIEKDVSPDGSWSWSIADSIARHAYEELAAIALASNDPGTARRHLARAVAIDEHILRMVLRPRPAGEMLESVQDASFIRLYHRLLALTVHHYAGDAQAVERALTLVLNRKSIALDLESRTRGLGSRLSEKDRTSVGELAKVRSTLSRLMATRAAPADSEYEQKVVLAFERGVSLEREVSASLLGGTDLAAGQRVTVSEVAARLPHDAVLVEFVRVQDTDPVHSAQTSEPDKEARYLVFTLTSSGRVSLVDLGAARAIDELVADLQASLRGHSHPKLVEGLLRDLYSRLWQPIAGLIGDPGQVIVSGDGEVHRVPFGALMDGEARFLIQRHRFAYVGSGRDLVFAQRGSTVPSEDLVLVANPDFGAVVPDAARPGTDALSGPAGQRFDPLPGTALEAQLIPPLVSGDKGRTILVGPAATKAALKAIRNPRILHIATHGVFLDRDTLGVEGRGYEHALIRSGLVLAGANNATSAVQEDDGMLTALEISDMDLSGTQLVVLSACDTGAGSLTRGQGVLGLRRAFALAGARGTLMTLWPVDDAVTVELMVSFYGKIRHLSPVEALHRAQTELIERLRTSGGFPDPRLWAPFIFESATGFATLPGG